MLPKEKRLRNTRDFKRVYQKGSFFSVELFSINFMPNRQGSSRLGIVVTKKVEPKSTRRNQVKRKFREAARGLYEKIPAGFDVIITIKAPAKEADFEKIRGELEKVTGRIKCKK